MNGVFDPGLQAERTALAWQRTALGLAAGSVGLGRLLLPVFGTSSYLITAAGIALCLWLWVHAEQRYRAVNRALLSKPQGALPSFALLALLCAGLCLLCGLAALFFALSRLAAR
ncbi:hypothetical protein UM93_08985 [Psychromicrobium lacuslunae]|uniref:DUF202 domain-containing protein n=1 Tax=Psychromicrobium lacuslunae TaxID=1618207 RepID=A0A0D4C3A0_9MICC|nr:hypothetical protein UM93_08985 [Psychromicrobium lacuslunae]